MKPLRMAIVASMIVGVAAIAICYATFGRRNNLRQTHFERVQAECHRQDQHTGGPDVLLRELAAHLKWVAQFSGGRLPAAPGDWCSWKIETELGLRKTMPEAEPPPSVDLPRVGALTGVSRGQILEKLGDPGCGRWNKVDGERPVWARTPCTQASRIQYSFYYLPKGYGGGGPELILSFGQDGTCTSAAWLRTQ
jgi:hypothetical protein